MTFHTEPFQCCTIGWDCEKSPVSCHPTAQAFDVEVADTPNRPPSRVSDVGPGSGTGMLVQLEPFQCCAYGVSRSASFSPTAQTSEADEAPTPRNPGKAGAARVVECHVGVDAVAG